MKKHSSPLLILQIEMAHAGNIEGLQYLVGLALAKAHSLIVHHRESHVEGHWRRHRHIVLLGGVHRLRKHHVSLAGRNTHGLVLENRTAVNKSYGILRSSSPWAYLHLSPRAQLPFM